MCFIIKSVVNMVHHFHILFVVLSLFEHGSMCYLQTLRIFNSENCSQIQCFNDEFANLSNGQRVVSSHSWFSYISWPTYRWYFKQPSFKYWFLRRVCQHQPISHWTSATWSFPCWIVRNCPRMPETGAVGRWLWWINLKLAAESSTLTTKEGDIEESISIDVSQ